jgi:hypothetical protein
MFTPRPAPDERPIATALKPREVLYYFDEPILFWADTAFCPILCNKTDETRDVNQYLAVQTNNTVLSQLKEGKVSVRASFAQPWCWIIETDKRFNVIKSWGLEQDSLPSDYLPDPGVGLYPYHGHVSDLSNAYGP